jgi:aminoglycoside phosphotransferase (APT) family kinase protein
MGCAESRRKGVFQENGVFKFAAAGRMFLDGRVVMTSPSTPIKSAPPHAQALVAEIGGRFAIHGEFVLGERIESGHINSTFRASYRQPDGSVRRYIFQSINQAVFKDPFAVMRNVERVTRHINGKVLRVKEDLGGQTLNLFPARDGRLWVEDANGEIWRCYNHIEGCVTHDIVENTRQAYQAAHAFGAFQDLVSDMDAAEIGETIPDFHHTRKRFERLLEVAAADPRGRLSSARPELEFIREREFLVDHLLAKAAAGELPLRVTHNDTKINNVMIDAESDVALCVIDLDTVMPGLSLYDFGDLVRTATSPAAEDEPDLGKVEMQMPMFEALVEGYLDAAGKSLTDAEVACLAAAGKIMTLEVGIRFLTDHLEGDVYFRTQRPQHNLDRCRTQLRLVQKIEERESEMEDFVRRVRQGRRKSSPAS